MTPSSRERANPSATRRRLLILATMFAVPAMAAPALENHERIRSIAEAQAEQLARQLAPAGARVEAQANRLDPRLHLAACADSLESTSPVAGQLRSRLSIGVRCPGAGGWSIYVPVQVHVFAKVVVLTAPAAAGEPLAAGELALEERDVAAISGAYLTRLQDAEGMAARRVLGPGAVLTTSSLQPMTIVHRGQQVGLVAGGSGFTVVTHGEALTDAAVGDQVRVRNLSSHQVVEGQVQEDGRVRVGI